MNALNKKLVRDLWHLRGQVFAIALVVACGVASYVSMSSTYGSLVESRDQYYSQYRFADVFSGLKRAPESEAKRLRELPGVAAVQTRLAAKVTLDIPDLPEPAQGKLVTVHETDPGQTDRQLYLLRGRLIEHGRPNEAVISGAFADANRLQPGDTLKAVLNGRLRELEIVGVALSPEYIYEIRPGDVFPDNRRFGVIWMERASVAAVFQMEDAFNDIALTLAPQSNEAGVIENVDRVLAQYGGTGAYGRRDQTSHRFINNELAELRVFGTVIPAVFLAVTAFLVHLVLTRLVDVEREQIGLLRAFGYTSIDIGRHYLKLAVLAIFGGIVFGMALGAWLGRGMNNLYGEFFHFPIVEFHVSLSVVFWSLVISVAAAAIGALSAVLKASGLPPAEAMRPEPPPNFHAGFIETSGMQKWLSTGMRVIVRNIVRRPAKALLSSIGISLSIGLLFVGFFFYDAINTIVAVQFENVQREDVEVSFNEPRPGRARFELGSLPGVSQVEVYRAVPAVLRHGNQSRRTAIMGLPGDAQLRRVVDKDLNVIKLPPDGLVIGATVADSLGVSKGDRITVEVTEGPRPVREVEVTAVVEELLGLGTYMEVRALNRLMGEGDTISGAFLSADGKQREKLLSTLKRTPGVAGVGSPKAALESFNETIAKTIGTSTFFMIGFACIIAFGVVYNGARIALAERGRELASLRVLGFTRGEIAKMLLGEQFALTLAAIPMGFAVGYGTCFLITKAIDAEIVRLPMVLTSQTFFYSAAIVTAASFISGCLVALRIKRMDLVAVLKTRE